MASSAPAFAAEEALGPAVRLPAKPSLEIAIEGRAADLLLHDINGDGYLDLFVAANRGGDDGPSYLFLSKEGKFQSPSWVSGDQSVSAGVAVGDLDADGNLDLVLVRYNHNPAVAYRGLGKGKFETKPFWESDDTQWAYGVYVADFDNDGSADIFAASGSPDLRIYRGGKEGPSSVFGWQYEDRRWASGDSAWVDIDSDGRRDLVLTHWMGPAVTVIRGRPQNFETKPSQVCGEPAGYYGLAAGDLDGDGFPEVAVGSTTRRMGDGRVRLYGNQRGRLTREPVWMSDDVDATASELILHDLDRDGDLDLLVLSGDHTAAYQNQKGKLAPAPFWRAAVSGSRARVADLDRNGFPDLITGGNGTVQVFHGGPDIAIRKAEPFPPMPELPPLAGVEVVEEPPEASKEDDSKIAALDFLGVKLAAITSALKSRYGLEATKGALVLSLPAGVNRRLAIGNLREGDVLIGVGSQDDRGRIVEPAKDPWDFRRLVLDYGRESRAHTVGVQWRCGPLHPSQKGSIRQEMLQLKGADWARLAGETEAEPPRVSMVPLQGTITVTDPEGQDHEREDGSFIFILWSGNSGQHRPVQVSKGRWKTEVPANVKLAVQDIKLGGKEAHLEADEWDRIEVPEDRILALRARWPAAAIVSVIGEDTGAELKGIDVVGALSWEVREALYPGDYPEKALLLSGAESPLDLSEMKKPRSQVRRNIYWIRSPGYAWGRIEVDFRSGGEKKLVLKRGAEAEITVLNFKPESKGVLRLRELKKGAEESEPMDLEARGKPILEMKPHASVPMLIEGLVPGHYAASVEIGMWFKDPEILGIVAVELKAGERSAATLSLNEPVFRGEPVPLQGTLFIPPAWGEIRPSLNIEALDLPDTSSRDDPDRFDRVKLSAAPDRPGLYSWSAGNVVPAKYVVSVRHFSYQQVIAVGLQGESNAKLEIGEPADVSVDAVDADTGKPADVDELRWHCVLPEGVRSWSPESAKADPDSGRFDFRAPVGRVVIDFLGITYRSPRETLELRPGKNQHTLRVTKSCGVRIRLKDGEATIRWNWEVHGAGLKGPEGKMAVRGTSSEMNSYNMAVSEPGWYELTLKPIEGFEPIPPQQVLVKPREFTEITVQLIRSK